MRIKPFWRGVGHASNIQFAVQAAKWGALFVTGVAAWASGQPLWVVLILALAAFFLVSLTARAALPVLDRIAQWNKARKRSPIQLQEELYYRSGYLTDPDGKPSEIMRAVFYLVAHNGRADGATLRNVQAIFQATGTQLVLPAIAADGSRHSRTDIRHGEYILFEVGRTLTKEFIGDVLRPNQVISDPEDWKYHTHCWEHGQRGFEISTVNPDSRYTLGQMGAQMHDAYGGMVFRIVVTADDVCSVTVEYRMNLFHIPADPAQAFKLVKAEAPK